MDWFTIAFYATIAIAVASIVGGIWVIWRK